MSSPKALIYHACQIVFLLLIALIGSGCSEEPEPTSTPEPIPTAPTPTAEATETPFPSPLPSATVTPTPTVSPTATPIPPIFEGYSFTLPSFWPDGMERPTETTQVRQTLAPADFSGWTLIPKPERFNLLEAPPITDRPAFQITAYPLFPYSSIDPLVGQEIDNLRKILENGVVEQDTISAVPHLPLLDSGLSQLVVAQVERLDFADGRGIRYLTQVGNESDAIVGPRLYYTYQGMTDDKLGYLSVTVPVSAAGFPLSDGEMTAEQRTALAENLPAYLLEQEAELSQLTATQFIPALSEIDAFVRSVSLNLPEPELIFDASGEVELTVLSPLQDGVAWVDRPLYIEGFTQPGEIENILVSLQAGTSNPLQQFISSERDGWFRAELLVPPHVQGPVELIIEGASGREVISLTILGPSTVTKEENTPSLTLINPIVEEMTAAEIPLFFEGEVANPIDEQITIGLLVNQCQNFVARQTIQISGGEWFGYIIPPPNLTGPACAIAYTGTLGQGTWREVRVPISLSPLEEIPAENKIALGNLSTLKFTLGTTVSLVGRAIAPEETQIVVRLFSPNDNLLAETAGPVTQFGIWTLSLSIPADIDLQGEERYRLEILNPEEEATLRRIPIDLDAPP